MDGADAEIIAYTIENLERTGRFAWEKQYIQHGSTTVYAHSIRVAAISLYLAESLHLTVDRNALIRGALLHDYFLYDWHQKNHGHRPHGFTHPYTALKNAKRDFSLNEVEENIIARHMFPLTPLPPRYIEAWIVCLADKYCAGSETIRPLLLFLRKKQRNSTFE